MDINNTVFLDFETRSAVSLKDVGAWRYSLDPSTKSLCLAYAIGMGEVKLWVEGQQQPKDLIHYFRNKRVRGWNAHSFERAIFENVCKKRLGWEVPKLEQIDDTMLDALTLALPAKLETCAEAMNSPEQKFKEGKALIQKLCKPITSGKKKGLFRERSEFMDDYVRLYDYCRQDVVAERWIATNLPYHLEGKEKKLSYLIARINERGLPIDLELVDAVIEGLDNGQDFLYERFFELTGVESPSKREQFRVWLESQGHQLPNMQAGTVEQLMTEQLTPLVDEALELYDACNNTSTAKFPKLRKMLCPDGTVKNNLIFNKASTGRLAGAGFQAQNLPSEKDKNVEVMRRAFLDRNYEFLHLFCGIQQAAKRLIRPTIRAPKGLKLIDGDLKGVEARGTSWVAREWKMLDNFAEGIDAYVSSASGMYHKSTEYVTGEERQAGKIAVLSGGFGGGWRALYRMAVSRGIPMTEEQAKKINRDFRKARPKLTKAWENFGEAAIFAVGHSGVEIPVKDTDGHFYFVREGDFLFMYLPSGRRLSFPYPQLEYVEFFGKQRLVVTAMWTNSSPKGNHKWMRREITGPSFFQSAVQAMCRDLLMDGHLRAEEQGYPLILSVHDEGLSMVPDDPSYNLSTYRRIMSQNASWCWELPVDSDCWEGYYFAKR